MTAVESKATLYMKLARVMGEMSRMKKSGKNTHFDYKFVTADDVANKVRQLLAAQNVAFFAAIVGRELVGISRTYTDKKTGEIQTSTLNRWVVNFEFTFACGDTGATETKPWSSEADSADDKGINKCATAAEKYFLLKTFIVSTGDEPDADADGASRRANAQQRQQPTPTQPTSASVSKTGTPDAAPKVSAPAASTNTTPAANGGSAKQEFFPEAQGAVVIPIPVLGDLDMQELGRRAFHEQLVGGRKHWNDLIVKMRDVEGLLHDGMTEDEVIEAIKRREAAKDLATEAGR